MLAETRHPPVHVVVDDYDLVALTGDVDVHEWHVEIAPAHGGVSSVVAKCHRPLEDRPALVLTPHSLYFTTNDRILGLARAKPA